MSARDSILLGNEYPYDASDAWWRGEVHDPVRHSEEWAYRIARGIIDDLMDRQGIKHGFNGVAEKTREEIADCMVDIINTVLEEALGKPQDDIMSTSVAGVDVRPCAHLDGVIE